MFYNCIKFLARCGLLFFFRRRISLGFPLHALKGPAIIAANHPNSMLDAVIIACACKQQVHFTIRSDMFQNPLFRFLLKFLNAIPVYRVSEDKRNIRNNFTIIDRCRDILKKEGIIIIFSEGVTVHEWKLKPLKSGTSKIVQHAISDEQIRDQLQVVPVGLTYSDFRHPAKTLIIQTGEVFYPGRQTKDIQQGTWKHQFNTRLFQNLQQVIPELHTTRTKAVNLWQIFITNTTYRDNRNTFLTQFRYQSNVLSAGDFVSPLQHCLKRFFFPLQYADLYRSFSVAFLLVVPALAGVLLNGLFYFPASSLVRKKTKNTIFFDSLFFGLLVTLYPVYILLLSGFLSYYTGLYMGLWIVLIPLTGWCCLQCWVFLVKIINFIILNPAERKCLQQMITESGANNNLRQDSD